MTIQQAKDSIGKQVVYITNQGNETGVITSVNEKYVFVRFGNNSFGIATNPEDLIL